MSAPKIVQVDKGKVHPNPWNPNVVPDHTMQALTANIDRAGFNQPVLVRPHPEREGEYEIVDGEHRWRTTPDDAKVPVIVRDFTDGEAKAQTIAMNKLRGEMEPADVARLVREIESEGIDLSELAEFTGYTGDELEGLHKLADFDWDSFENTPAPPADDEWVTLSYRVPADVGALFSAEVDRLKAIIETEHDHLAIEVMAVSSSQSSPAEMTGENTP